MKEQFSFTGRVIEGHHLGHTLGFPTANIVVTPGERVPAFGVYAAWVTLPDGTHRAAVTNLGVRPTVEEAGALWVESYLLDFSGDLYGQELTVTLCHFLRPERRFPDVEALRQAIARDLREYKGMAVPPEQIVVGAGAEYLYLLLAQLLGREAVFAVEDPGYPKIRQVYGKCGAACRPVPLDGQGVPPEALEAAGASVVHLSPAHHYPTGLVTPIGRRQALLRWAEKAGGIIIEDDYDSEFRLTGKPIPSLQSMDITQKVIYINTFTKSLSSTMRISYMVLPPKLANRFLERLSFYSCTVSNFEQYALMRFINEGCFEKHINRMRNFYHKQRDSLLDAIKNSPLASYVTIMEEDSGLHFLLKVNTELSDEELMQRALQKGVKLNSLSAYYHDSPDDFAAHTFIINYSYLNTTGVEDAIKVLYDVIKK